MNCSNTDWSVSEVLASSCAADLDEMLVWLCLSDKDR